MLSKNSIWAFAGAVSAVVAISLAACGDDAPAKTPTPKQCDSGKLDCDGQCVDLDSNPDHCGVCDGTCNSTEVCSRGTCKDKCDNGLTNCNRACVDTNTNVDHCGGCGDSCGDDMSCIDGTCSREVLCSGDMVGACNGVCINQAYDDDNCGGCGIECGAEEVCFEGTCVVPSSTGCDGELMAVCNEVCTNLAADLENCGGCGNACAAPDGSHQVAVCKSGVCDTSECEFGYFDCDESIVGCETSAEDLQSNPNHCGHCGVKCGPFPNFMEMDPDQSACVSGKCINEFPPEDMPHCLATGGKLTVIKACPDWGVQHHPIPACCAEHADCDPIDMRWVVACECQEVNQCWFPHENFLHLDEGCISQPDWETIMSDGYDKVSCDSWMW